MIFIINKQRAIAIDNDYLQSIVGCMLNEVGYNDFDVALLFSGKDRMRSYNRDYRNKDKPTDILSFPFHPNFAAGEKIIVEHSIEKDLGDIIICPQVVKKDAEKRWGCSFEERLVVLMAHGIAHLLNYDHQTDEEYEEMNQVEAKLVAAANNYIKKNYGKKNK